MMSDTCTTHRSRVPTEELQKDKRRSDDSAGRERTRPGLLVCVLCVAVVREGLPLYFCVCLFLLLNSLNVRRFLPPSSRSTNCVTVTYTII